MARNAIFTVCTPNYLKQAAVFIAGLTKAVADDPAAPDVFVFVLGATCRQSEIRIAGCECIYVENVVDAKTLARLAGKYTPAEFCWALKPVLFRWMLDRFDLAFYFDTDIWFTGRFLPVLNEMVECDILLTPHYLVPFGCKTVFGVKALSLLRGGVFNAGFIGVRQSTTSIEFIDWWSSRVLEHGRNDPDNGMCGDQKWLDLVPALFPSSKISRHHGLNVGYWNLHERNIRRVGETYLSNDDELIFVHFSGFDSNYPRAFSNHISGYSADGAILQIIEDYLSVYRSVESRDTEGYLYRKWWHRRASLYRKIVAIWRNPRNCENE